MQFAARAQCVLRGERELIPHGVAKVSSVRIHRHTHRHRESRFVPADVHRVPGALPVDVRVKLAAVKVSVVMQVERLGVVAHQIHLRVHETFVGSVVQAALKNQQVSAALSSQSYGVVCALGICGSNLVAAAVGVVAVGGP